MKYRPVLPQHNDNVSHQRPWGEFILLVGAAITLLILVYWFIGFFVDIAVDSISPDMEAAIFEAVDTDKWLDINQGEISDNAAVQTLLDGLSQCTDIGYPLKVQVVDTDKLNALAVPGGNILFFSGLLDKLQTENALAFVLAHEIAHFNHRDHLRSMGRGVVLLALSTAFTGANSDLSQLMAPINSLDAAQFSQEREQSADAAALDIINCYYGHVGGATEFFEMMAGRGEEQALMHYFSSHPQVLKRIDAINAIANSKGYSLGATTTRKPQAE